MVVDLVTETPCIVTFIDRCLTRQILLVEAALHRGVAEQGLLSIGMIEVSILEEGNAVWAKFILDR